VRKSTLHDRLAAAGACFGEVAGYERANWFAAPGTEPRYEYSYGRQNWFDLSAAEHRAVREQVGLFDQSSFAKFVLKGADAAAVLGRMCANEVDVPIGKVVYTQWLNARGGIEADLTVTREADDAYLIVSACATQTRDFHWLSRSIPDAARAVALDVSSAYAVVGLMGPRSRDLLAILTDADLSTAAFPFATSQIIDLGYARVRASRITYVGELGYELYIPSEFAQSVYDEIVAAGRPFGLRLAGYHALNSLRMEKAYRHWGHDISDEDTPLEAGLQFAIAWNKPGGFVGREALEQQRAAGLRRRLVAVALERADRMLYHNEPIWRNGELVGRISSAMFGHTIGAPLGLGYLANSGAPVSSEWIASGRYEIEVADERLPARVSLRPFYDPANERVKR
jgi:4-methylaminobutanoate oxidase (formaldehyde-forming)